MRYFVTLCLFFLFFAGYGQQKRATITNLNRDSLIYTFQFEENWLFHSGDDSVFSRPNLDETGWDSVGSPRLAFHPNQANKFKGIGWLRLHIMVDSSLTGRPLGLAMTQLGASEIYIDGKLVKRYGVIGRTKDSCKYFNPQRVPFTIVFDTAGEHVLAVRYANYAAHRNYKVYLYSDAAFRLTLAEADGYIRGILDNAVALTFVFILLSGIFIALSLLHLMLFLYYRAAKSNLYFSIFCLSLSLLFYAAFLTKYASFPQLLLKAGAAVFFSGVLACFALSGFSNALFGKRKLRFYIIGLYCLCIMIFWFFEPIMGLYGIFFLIGVVSIEAIALTIYGIYTKVKGARIIGIGILFLTLFLLFIFVCGLLNIGVDLNDSTPSGQVMIFVLALAILSMPFCMSAYLAWNFSSANKDLKAQLKQVQLLSEKTLEQEQEKKRILETQKEDLEKEVKLRTAEVVQQHEELKAEKKKSDDLLLNILPGEVAEELKEKGSSEARYFDQVSVLFTDFVAFTKAGERMTPQELVSELDTCFKAFDDIISRHNIEKIKTIGDAYLAVSGLPVADVKHAENAVSAAQEILQFMKARKEIVGDKTFEIRIGIHSGSVVAGIVGIKKFAYDIWGDTVNTAARMEQNSETGKINISQTTYELVKERFECSYRGQISAKNKGELNMYFVEKEINR
jgi:class 3 adenylate cyclase